MLASLDVDHFASRIEDTFYAHPFPFVLTYHFLVVNVVGLARRRILKYVPVASLNDLARKDLHPLGLITCGVRGLPA